MICTYNVAFFRYIYRLTSIRTQKAVKNHQICLPMSGTNLLCGARTVGLVIRGLYAISCLNTDGGVPSFCFPADLVFQERASMPHTQVC